jgi:5-methylcytosine-specific restriction endonuclease McrA
MPKLKSIKPLVGKLPPRLATQAGDETQRSRFRDDTQAHRRWYKTARWQKLRWSVLVRDLFTCQMCKGIQADTSQLVCDHIDQHHGNEAKFWAGPFQTLCKPCHDRTKQCQERRA